MASTATSAAPRAVTWVSHDNDINDSRRSGTKPTKCWSRRSAPAEC